MYQHGYRESGPFVSVVTSKVKGAEIVFDTDEWMDNCPKPLIPETLLDHTDLVIPPQVRIAIVHTHHYIQQVSVNV